MQDSDFTPGESYRVRMDSIWHTKLRGQVVTYAYQRCRSPMDRAKCCFRDGDSQRYCFSNSELEPLEVLNV